LAWRPGEAEDRTSCLVVLDERGSLVANSFAGSVEEISAAVESYAAGDEGVVLAIDAPLSVPNARGTRPIERVLSKVALPAYSASRKMFGEGPTYAEELLAALEEIGVGYADYPFRRDRDQRVAVEVDASAALKVLAFERSSEVSGGRSKERSGGKSDKNSKRSGGQEPEDPEQRLREMQEIKLRKGNKEARAAAIREAVDLLWNTPGLRLRTNGLSADLDAPENLDLSRLEVSQSFSHAQLDRAVSLVEGTLAAYTAYRHWKGRDGSLVVGAGPQGSVLLPAGPRLHDRVAEECRTAKVPFV
jgi:predicted RNase H-like nuclease